MEMDSSDARKEEAARARDGLRGVLPKKEIEGGSGVAIVELLCRDWWMEERELLSF